MIQSRNKILLIRFSSFGDVTQSLSIPTRLKELNADIHWVTRSDLAILIEGHPFVDKIWKLDRATGIKGLFSLIWQLKKERYSHIYDAHNNLRSLLITLFLRPPLALERLFDPPLFIRKSQKRLKRFFLFRLRKNFYQMPFSGQRDLLEPLKAWGLSDQLPPTPQIKINAQADSKIGQMLADKNINQFVALAPSAAYELKRWPIEHWKKLIALMPSEKFILLGGPEDDFLKNIEAVAPDRVFNWAGKTNLAETTAVVAKSKSLVSNDTGILHLGEQLGHKTIALMGPAPFGFPSRPTTTILQLDLLCRPCSKHGQGPCINQKFHQCLVDIRPETVESKLRETFSS